MKNSQVAHIWANQSKPKAKGSNFYFEGDTIYSYGPHYLAGKIHTVKGAKVALVNSTRYSVCTSHHTSKVAGALQGLMPFLYSSDVTSIKTALKESLKGIENQFAYYLKRRVVRYEDYIKWSIEAIERTYNGINAFRRAIGLKSIGINNTKLNAVKAHLQKQYERYLVLNTPEMIAKREAERNKRALKKNEKAIQDFRAGKVSKVPGLPNQLLRINGETIETSNGASVPLETGLNLYRAIMRCDNVAGYGIGHFTVDRIEDLDLGNDKLIVIGCHRILLSEVQSTLNQKAA